MKKLTTLVLLLLLSASPALAQRPGVCIDTTFSATGRTLLNIPGGTDGMGSASFTYRTTGSPGSLSIAIEAGNVLVATETPIEQIAAVTTTSGQVDMGAVPRNFRFWYANVATLSGGSSPTIILTSCFLMNPASVALGTGAFSIGSVDIDNGQAADGAAVAGNPIRIAGSDGSNTQNILTDLGGRLALVTIVVGADGASNNQIGKFSDFGGSGTGFAAAFPFLFNGTTWDRARGDTAGAQVQGPAADGAAVAGNPVRMAGKDSSGNTQDFAVSTSGILAQRVFTGADAFSNSDIGVWEGAVGTDLLSASGPWLFNGTTWDRQRNNEEITVLASAARTAQTDSSDLTNFNAQGILLTVDISLDPSTASITPNIQSKDPVSGNYSTIWTAAAALTGTGTTTYLVYPGVLAADFNGTEAVSIALPRTWRFRMTVADAESMTWSAGSSYNN